jgi:predicted MFS family arabinose efflux permease
MYIYILYVRFYVLYRGTSSRKNYLEVLVMEEQAKVNSRVWLMLICAWAAIAVAQFTVFGYGMMMPSIMADFGLDTAVMGQIAGVAAWCQVISLIPLSLLLARANPKFSVPVVILCTAAGIFIYGRAVGVPMLYIGYILMAAFSNLIATLLVGAKVRGVPSARYTMVNGIENFVQPVGQTIAVLFIAQLMAFLGGWRGIFTTVSIIMVVALVLYFIVWGNGKRITYGQMEAPATAEVPQVNFGTIAREAFGNRVVWLTGLAWPGTTIVWIAMFYYFPTYAITELGFDLPTAGLILAMIPIFSAIASLTSPLLAKKIGYDKPLICTWGIILPIAYFMMMRVSSVPLLCLFSAIAGYGAYCFVPLAFTNVYKIGLSQPAITLATGILLTFVTVGIALAGSVVGTLTGVLGVRNALQVACLSPIWFGILTLFLPELGYKKMQQLQAGK